MNRNIVFVVSILILVIVTLTECYKDSSEKSCECINDNCGCCEYLNWSEFKINGTVCSNFTYLPNDYGISVTITYNTYTIFNETVSARNPPPFCVGIPELEKIRADVCLRLYDLNFAKKHFHGCMKVSVSIYHVIHKTINVGCFDIPELMLHNVLRSTNNVLNIVSEEWKKLKELPVVNMI